MPDLSTPSEPYGSVPLKRWFVDGESGSRFNAELSFLLRTTIGRAADILFDEEDSNPDDYLTEALACLMAVQGEDDAECAEWLREALGIEWKVRPGEWGTPA